MSEITFEAVVYDGKPFAPDDDGAATTDQGKRLQALGFSQRQVVHPKYDHEFVLDHGAHGRVSPGQCIVVHENAPLAIIDGKPVKPQKKVVKKATKKASKK